MKKFNAFTLAEVLITLGVIGVVAVFILPSLIQKYQMKQFEVALKKQYSNLQNTVNYVSFEENLAECYYECKNSCSYTYQDCINLQNFIIDKLGLSEVENTFKNNYAHKEDVINNGGKSTNTSYSYDEWVSGSKSYLSKDGCIYFFNKGFGRFQMFVLLDLNGGKAPNKWGYDLFLLGLKEKNNSLIVETSTFGLKEKGGFYPSEILKK